MSIEDRRKPIHGGLTAAGQILLGAKICPAADILASHTPYLHKANHFLEYKGSSWIETIYD